MAPTDLKQKLVLATRNMNKADELKLLLASDTLEILDLSAFPDAPAVDETSSSLRGNAKLKASSAHIYTGLWAVGDDTGLYVHALDGKPGVHSARFAGKNADSHENRSLVLDLLANKSDRTAKFVTILALAHDGQINYFEGQLNGHISMVPLSTQGFGYESIFIPDGLNISLAQLSKEDKNMISHRAESAISLMRFIDKLLNQ